MKNPTENSLKGKKSLHWSPCPFAQAAGLGSFIFTGEQVGAALRIKEITFQTQVLRFLILELFIASIGPSCTLK